MESVENVSFYFHNVSNKFCYSHRVSESLKVMFTEVALPIMIVAFLSFVCQDAKIAPNLTSMNKTFIVTFKSFGHTVLELCIQCLNLHKK